MELWDELLREYHEVVHIPMSSGLSATCATATALAMEDAYAGKVHVVDNQRISVTQRQSVMDALGLAEAGMNGVQIKEVLENEKFESSIYIMVDTLKYLKKGGRITPAAAMIEYRSESETSAADSGGKSWTLMQKCAVRNRRKKPCWTP